MIAQSLIIGATPIVHLIFLPVKPFVWRIHLVFLLIRTYALYGRSRRMLYFLIAVCAGSLGGTMVGPSLLPARNTAPH